MLCVYACCCMVVDIPLSTTAPSRCLTRSAAYDATLDYELRPQAPAAILPPPLLLMLALRPAPFPARPMQP